MKKDARESDHAGNSGTCSSSHDAVRELGQTMQQHVRHHHFHPHVHLSGGGRKGLCPPPCSPRDMLVSELGNASPRQLLYKGRSAAYCGGGGRGRDKKRGPNATHVQSMVSVAYPAGHTLAPERRSSTEGMRISSLSEDGKPDGRQGQLKACSKGKAPVPARGTGRKIREILLSSSSSSSSHSEDSDTSSSSSSSSASSEVFVHLCPPRALHADATSACGVLGAR